MATAWSGRAGPVCVAAKCGNKKRRNVTGNGMTTTRRAALLGLPGFLAGAGGADGATLDGLKQSTESEALKELRNLRERTEETEEESYERLENLLQQLSADRQKYEEEAREEAFNSNRLCRTPFGVDVVGLTETIALIGATVGGLVARRRKKDVEKLNDKLRSVNLSLRQQARAGTLYAPALNYAPAPAPPQAQSQAAQVPEAGVERQEEMNETRAALKKARRLVKEGNPSSAMVHFNKALVETRRSGDRILERRAVRGLAACKRDLGDAREAIEMLRDVLRISDEIGEHTGDADAYGMIADLFTEVGDLEQAGIYYDRWLWALEER